MVCSKDAKKLFSTAPVVPGAGLPLHASGSNPGSSGPRVDSTEVLLQQVREGNESAKNAVFHRYIGPLRRWASGRLPGYARDAGDTEDLVQEALIQSLRRIDGFESRWKGAFHSYLRQAVLNRIRDHVRRAAARERALDKVAENQGEVTSPLEEVIGLEALARYEAALEQLSPGDRELIIARMEFDCGFQELADYLGKPSADSVRMGVKRALMRLAKAMEDVDGESPSDSG